MKFIMFNIHDTVGPFNEKKNIIDFRNEPSTKNIEGKIVCWPSKEFSETPFGCC